jgi:undecaprenyl-diphosphatase
LGAVLAYFWRDVVTLLQGAWDFLRGKKTAASQFLLNLVVATIPIVIVGVFFDYFVGDSLKGLTIFAWMSILFGLLLGVADRGGAEDKNFSDMTLRQALFLGIAQVLSVVNGVSRSGICITTARLMGFKRREAAHFAFLMSIPTIMAAVTLKGVQLVKSGDVSMLGDACLIAGGSFVIGLLTIRFLMNWLLKHTFDLFVLYRILLGGLLLLFLC